MVTKIPFNWPNFKIASDWTLFLDRDGVINERMPDDYIKNWDEFKFLPGVLDALGVFSNYFTRIFIVTNQAGIEKGVLSHEELKEIHEHMMEYILFHGGRIDEIYYCPYKADLDPLCRKPNPGMALQAKKDYPEIIFNKSLMIGDSDSDIAFGNNLGMKTILTGNKPDITFLYNNSIPDCRLDSLTDVATYLNSLY
ncbi:MAG: HAD family hydrolase [Saprospiraceae bacterium]|nr:HAD family hydrolase [Saprospiraceae bacterium]